MRVLFTVILFSILVTGCMNMPTPPSQITAAYTSELKYVDLNCDVLVAEINSLARRENQLVSAQEQRINTSEVQAFWLGYGQGDGVEASELANVKGEKEAVRKAIEKKKCENATATLIRLDNEKARKEELANFEALAKKEYEDCISSLGRSSCSEEVAREKTLSRIEKEKTSSSYVSLLHQQAQTATTDSVEPGSKRDISEETLRKAKTCQSKGGVWINDQCIISIE
jgi:hypothetical protein